MVTVDPVNGRRRRRARERRSRLLAWLGDQLAPNASEIPEAVPAISTPTRLLLGAYAIVGIVPSILLARGHGALAWAAAGVVTAIALSAALLVGRRVDGAVAALAVAADIDAVTGTRSRGWGERHLRRQLARVDLRRRWVVALLDLDRFKQVNDVHGHLGGDRALRVVARTLDDSLRAGDWAARWGGDEFLVVLDARIDHALEALERVRLAIAEHEGKGAPRGLSVSIGATLTRPGDDVEDVVDRADRALYAVKSSGGNGVQVTAGR
jgi:diguanylate cyclase (GGDEF)-like protein